jgi:glycerol-3-phosphate acyltransferase PlsY
MEDQFGSLTWTAAAGAVLAYLIGTIPFGLLLTRLAGYGDIRAIGSGNIGATNVLRTGNKGLAALTLLLDGAKGAAAVPLAMLFGPALPMAAIGAVAAVLGHLFPPWLGFRGGKGVATTLGALLALAWPVGLLVCATWLVAAFLFRYSSLAALIAAVLAPVYAYLLGLEPIFVWCIALLAVMVVLRHHENIRRLLAGTESKIRLKKA